MKFCHVLGNYETNPIVINVFKTKSCRQILSSINDVRSHKKEDRMTIKFEKYVRIISFF